MKLFNQNDRGPLLMALTLSYLAPYGAGVTPSLALQAQTPKSVVVATLNTTAGTDTSAQITHAFNLTAAEISQGFPILAFVSQDGTEISSPWFEVSQNPNFTIVGRANVGAGGTTKVFVERPATNFR